jgi:hypothetical protein
MHFESAVTGRPEHPLLGSMIDEPFKGPPTLRQVGGPLSFSIVVDLVNSAADLTADESASDSAKSARIVSRKKSESS